MLPDIYGRVQIGETYVSQCTYRCVVLPDGRLGSPRSGRLGLNAPTGAWCSLTHYPKGNHNERQQQSQCTYRCVVLPDRIASFTEAAALHGLNAPTGAWCSLTYGGYPGDRCHLHRLNAPTGAWCSLTEEGQEGRASPRESQCTYRCVVLPDCTHCVRHVYGQFRLNAPTGAWCSLTPV